MIHTFVYIPFILSFYICFLCVLPSYTLHPFNLTFNPYFSFLCKFLIFPVGNLVVTVPQYLTLIS